MGGAFTSLAPGVPTVKQAVVLASRAIATTVAGIGFLVAALLKPSSFYLKMLLLVFSMNCLLVGTHDKPQNVSR